MQDRARRLRRLVSLLSTPLLVLVLLGVSGGGAQAATPTVTVRSTVDRLSATVTYSVNRGPRQIASRTCTLNGAGTSCGAITAGTNRTTTYRVGYAGLAAGVYIFVVKVGLTDHNVGSGSTTFRIVAQKPTCSVTAYAVTYDGNAHLATGTCTGVGGAAIAGTLDLSATSHSAAGSYSDAWSFTPTTPGYTQATGTVADHIAQAAPSCSVSGYHVVHDGSAHTATGSCTGVDGQPVSGLDLSGTTHTSAGSYSDGWSFHSGTGNYLDASGTVTDVIDPAAAPSCTVLGYDLGYDGNLHYAPAGSCTGTGGQALGGSWQVTGAHSEAGSYSDSWTFTPDDPSYAQASGSVTDVIEPVAPSCQVTGYDVTWDGKAHTLPASGGSCTGVSGDPVTGTFDLSGTTHTATGTYGDTWAFTPDSGNYSSTSGSVTDVVEPRAPSCTAPGYDLTYDGNLHYAEAGSCTGIDGQALTGSWEVFGAHSEAGTYSDPWLFVPDDPSYLVAGGTVTDVIGPATPICAVTGYTATWTGETFVLGPSHGSCTGVGGEPVAGTFDFSATAHSIVGTYGDPWSFTPASTDYVATSGTVTDVINSGGGNGGGGGGGGGGGCFSVVIPSVVSC